MLFNAGVQQQLTNAMTMKLDYVGSLSRHQYINNTVNTALIRDLDLYQRDSRSPIRRTVLI